MNILFLSPHPLDEFNPADLHFRNQIHQSAKAHRVHLIEAVNLANENRQELPFAKSRIEFGRSADDLLAPKMEVSAFDSLLSEEEFDAYLERIEHGLNSFRGFKPDIIHVNYLWIVTALARSHFAEHPLIANAYFADVQVAQHYETLLRRVKNPIREVDAVVFSDPDVGKAVSRIYGIRSDRMHLIPWSVNGSHFRPPTSIASQSFKKVAEQVGLSNAPRNVIRSLLLAQPDDPRIENVLRASRHLTSGDGVLSMVVGLIGVDNQTLEYWQTRFRDEPEISFIRIEHYHVIGDLMRGSQIVFTSGKKEVVATTSLAALACGCYVISPTRGLSDTKTEGLYESSDEELRSVVDKVIQIARDKGRLHKVAVDIASRSGVDSIARHFDSLYQSLKDVRST